MAAMDFQAFAAAYQTKTDEELLALNSEAEQLTSEARMALNAELSRRRIESVSSVMPETPIPEMRSEHQKPGVTSLPESAQIRTRAFIEETLRLYNNHRWMFIKLIFPAVLIGYVSVMLARYEGRHIYHAALAQGDDRNAVSVLVEVQVVSLAGWLVSWLASCVCFGAICSAAEHLGDVPDISVATSFSSVRTRLGPLLKLSLLLFGILILLEPTFWPGPNSWFWTTLERLRTLSPALSLALTYLLPSVGPLIVSRFALSIPAVLLDNYEAGEAIFRSDELTEGKWPILAVLLLKSALGGYLAGMLPYWVIRLLVDIVVLPSWFYWGLAATSIAAVTVVEPIMFIGFALLYVKTSPVLRKPGEIAAAFETAGSSTSFHHPQSG